MNPICVGSEDVTCQAKADQVSRKDTGKSLSHLACTANWTTAIVVGAVVKCSTAQSANCFCLPRSCRAEARVVCFATLGLALLCLTGFVFSSLGKHQDILKFSPPCMQARPVLMSGILESSCDSATACSRLALRHRGPAQWLW